MSAAGCAAKVSTTLGKRKYTPEDEPGDDGYVEVECPECGAPITARFQRRRQRRLHCPACLNSVTVSLEEEETDQPLIQLRPPKI